MAGHRVQARLTMEDGFTATIRKDIGPINLQFQIPMFCASKLQVRYLQIMKVRHRPQRHAEPTATHAGLSPDSCTMPSAFRGDDEPSPHAVCADGPQVQPVPMGQICHHFQQLCHAQLMRASR